MVRPIIRRNGYNGNQNLKRVGERITLTPEMMAEYARCKVDWKYFIETYCTIVTVDFGKIKFALRDYQKTFLERIEENRYNLIKIPRQYGKTEAVGAMLLWYVLFNSDYRIAVLAHKKGQAFEILDRIKLSYELLPKWLQQGVKEWNKSYIVLENDSKIFAEATSAGSVRGRTYNFVYLDEFAHVEPNEQEAFFTGTYPVISAGDTSKLVITTTPKGLEYFYHLWKKSEQGKNTYVRTEVHWSEMPGRDEAWKQATIDNTSERQFSQEFECTFLGSMNTLIDGNVIGRIISENPFEMLEDNKTFHRFKKPDKTRSYCLIVDVAKGVGGDHSAFSIIDVTTMPYEIVATYYDNLISYLVLPNVIYRYAEEYNNAYVLIELNELGQSVADELRFEYEYENMFMTQSKPRVGQIVNGGFGGQRIEFGVKMNKQVKRIGCASLKTIVEKDFLKIPDQRIVTELSHFVEKGASWEAEKTYHDDLTMTLVSFAWLTTQPYFKEITGTNAGKNLLKDAMQMVEDDVLPGGWMDDGHSDLHTLLDSEKSFDTQMRDEPPESQFTAAELAAAQDIWKKYGV